jgi:hypothetical protein
MQVSAATQAGLALPAGRGSPYSYQVNWKTHSASYQHGGCILEPSTITQVPNPSFAEQPSARHEPAAFSVKRQEQEALEMFAII